MLLYIFLTFSSNLSKHDVNMLLICWYHWHKWMCCRIQVKPNHRWNACACDSLGWSLRDCTILDLPIALLLLLRPEKAAARRRRTVRYALNFTVTETRTLEISLTSLSHFCTLSFSFPSVFLLWYTLPSAKWSVGGSSLRRGLCVDEWPFGAPGLLLMCWFCWFTRFHMQREDGGWRAVCLACSSKWNWIRSENPNQRGLL